MTAGRCSHMEDAMFNYSVRVLGRRVIIRLTIGSVTITIELP